jgi:hypothetical protein
MTVLTMTSNYSPDETKMVLHEFWDQQLNFVGSRMRRFSKECEVFEQKYNMSSDVFLQKFDSGELGDDVHWFDWYASCRGRDVWSKKFNILRDISWKV